MNAMIRQLRSGDRDKAKFRNSIATYTDVLNTVGLWVCVDSSHAPPHFYTPPDSRTDIAYLLAEVTLLADYREAFPSNIIQFLSSRT
jgi:hypothetical protein